MNKREVVRNKKVIVLLCALGLFAYAPVIASAQTTTVATTTIALTIATSSAATTTSPVIATNIGIEAQVQNYFADTPVMIAIANCESGFRQFDNSGQPLNGGAGGMVGVFQISSAVHTNFALSLGMDINTVSGNLAYAKYLYQQEGTEPWMSSSGCWNQVSSVPAQIIATSIATSSLSASDQQEIRLLEAVIVLLQQILANLMQQRNSH